MSKILMALNGQSEFEIAEHNYDFIVAVDGGYDFLIKQNIKPDVLIGDLDSISNFDDVTCEAIKFDSIKDDTDFKLAISYIKENFEEYTIDVVNYKSMNRIEHFLANLRLLDEKITFIDEYSCIYILKNGHHEILKSSKYISFLPLTDVKSINLENTKYTLQNYNSNAFDTLMISNEITSDKCKLSFKSGIILVIESTE